jgi:hypothetical protein
MTVFTGESEEVVDLLISEIANQLFDQWHESNLDEGIMYADWKICSMSDSNYFRRKFNEHYNIQPNDEFYLQVEED